MIFTVQLLEVGWWNSTNDLDFIKAHDTSQTNQLVIWNAFDIPSGDIDPRTMHSRSNIIGKERIIINCKCNLDEIMYRWNIVHTQLATSILANAFSDFPLWHAAFAILAQFRERIVFQSIMPLLFKLHQKIGIFCKYTNYCVMVNVQRFAYNINSNLKILPTPQFQKTLESEKKCFSTRTGSGASPDIHMAALSNDKRDFDNVDTVRSRTDNESNLIYNMIRNWPLLNTSITVALLCY